MYTYLFYLIQPSLATFLIYQLTYMPNFVRIRNFFLDYCFKVNLTLLKVINRNKTHQGLIYFILFNLKRVEDTFLMERKELLNIAMFILPDYFLNNIISDAFQKENRLVIWLFVAFGYVNMIRNFIFYFNFLIIYKR